MKNKQKIPKTRNWVLVIVSLVLMLFGLALLVISIVNIGNFGWFSLMFGLGGLTTIGAAVMSIITNDPSWILLDLIIPG